MNLGLSATTAARFRRDVRALVAHAEREQEQARVLAERLEEQSVAEIQRLALDAEFGRDLGEVIALASEPIPLVRRTRTLPRPPDPVVEEQLAQLAEEMRAARSAPRPKPRRRLIEFTSSPHWRGWRVVREEVLEQRERDDAERRANLATTRREPLPPYRGRRGWLIVRPQTREVLTANGRSCTEVRLDASGNLVRAPHHTRRVALRAGRR